MEDSQDKIKIEENDGIQLIREPRISMGEILDFIKAVIEAVKNCTSENKTDSIKEIVKIATEKMGLKDLEIGNEAQSSCVEASKQ